MFLKMVKKNTVTKKMSMFMTSTTRKHQPLIGLKISFLYSPIEKNMNG